MDTIGVEIRGTTTKEIVRGFREQSRNLTEDRYAFDCLIPRRTLTVYNQEKSREALESKNDRQISLPSSCQSWGTQKEEGTITQKKNMNKKKIRNENYWFPVYELVLDRYSKISVCYHYFSSYTEKVNMAHGTLS